MAPDPAGVAATLDGVLASLWSAADDLSRLRPRDLDEYRVTIFGSARVKPGDPIYLDVRDLARRLAERGCAIVTGGGPGLMQAANEGERLGDPENRRKTIGLRVELPFEQKENPFVEESYVHRTFFSRLNHFVQLSSAFVVFEGGVGTTLETLMVWQLLQVRHIRDVPLVLVGQMWRDLVAWAREHMLGGPTPLAGAADLEIPRCVASADEAFAIIAQHHAQVVAQAV